MERSNEEYCDALPTVLAARIARGGDAAGLRIIRIKEHKPIVRCLATLGA